jgi:hypothetical protein
MGEHVAAELLRIGVSVNEKSIGASRPFANGAEGRERSVRTGSDNSVQPRLRLGMPGTSLEREADSVAAQVAAQMAVRGSEFQRPTGRIRRFSADSHGLLVPHALEAAIERVRGYGQPLAPSIRQPMQRAFGTDFGRVRVHTDAHSDMLSRLLDAKAFTTGTDIFFRQGTFAPESQRGRELLAHELTHCVQQAGSVTLRNAQDGTYSGSGASNVGGVGSVIQRAPPGVLQNTAPNYPNPIGAFVDPQTNQHLARASEVHMTTAAAQPQLLPYVPPDGTRVLGYGFLQATAQTSGMGSPYNGVRFHLINAAVGGPNDSRNLVPVPATANQNAGWTAFELRLKGQYLLTPIHVEVSVTNWQPANAVPPATPANHPLRQNLPFFPQTVTARLWAWDNNQPGPGYKAVANANPVVLAINAVPATAGNAAPVYISNASNNQLKTIFGCNPNLAWALSRQGARTYLSNLATPIDSAQDAFDELTEAIRKAEPNPGAYEGAVESLIEIWPKRNGLQAKLKSERSLCRVNPQTPGPVGGTFDPR